MAVAVASFPHASQMSPYYANEAQEALLDALLNSCEKPNNPPLESFGRELKPYFASAEYPSIPAAKTQTTHKKSARNRPGQQPVATAAAAAAASTKQPSATAKVNNVKVGFAPKKLPAANRSRASPPKKRDTGKTLSTEVPSDNAPLLAFNSGEMAAFLSWAGPGFYVAPNPDKLPLPSPTLLD